MSTDFIARLRARCGTRGFTLIELMVTLAVAAILTMIAVPSFRHILISTNLSDINNDLAGDLQYARTEAVSRQMDIAVQSSSGNWQNGWTVETEPASGTASVLRTHSAIPSQYVVTAGIASSVTYTSQGMISNPADATEGTCFTISSSGYQPSRFLQVLPPGMLQQTTSATAPSGSGCPSPTP